MGKKEMGRIMDKERVNFDAEKIETAMERFGISQQDFSRSLGKSASWYAFLKKQNVSDSVPRATVALMEQRLFLTPGSLVVEKRVEEEPKAKPPVVSEGVGIVLKQIVSAVGNHEEEQQKRHKEIAEAIAENTAVLQEVLQKEKEICTLLARVFSAMERGKE